MGPTLRFTTCELGVGAQGPEPKVDALAAMIGWATNGPWSIGCAQFDFAGERPTVARPSGALWYDARPVWARCTPVRWRPETSEGTSSRSGGSQWCPR